MSRIKINWKVRLRNKVWLTSFLATVLSFVFDLFSLLDVTPPLDETMVTHFLTAVLTLLTALGVIIDPTTQGVTDSDRAMTYD